MRLRTACSERSFARHWIVLLAVGWFAAWALPAAAQEPPPNDSCAAATAIGFGEFTGATTFATPDGGSLCDVTAGGLDTWYALTFPEDQRIFVETPEGLGMTVSVHTGCPGTPDNELICSFTVPQALQKASLSFDAVAGQTYYLRSTTTDDFGDPSPSSYSFRVGPGGTVRGRVTDPQGQPVPDIDVLVFSNGSAPRIRTDADGNYEVGDLKTANYQVFAGNESPYVAEVWDDIPCPHLNFCSMGTRIAVEIDTVTPNIDFVLELGAVITGTVRDDDTGQPLEGVLIELIELIDGTNELRLLSQTDAAGVYRFEGLDSGSYALVSELVEEYRPELWDNVPCNTFNCTPSAATPVVVERGETATGIDFGLDRGTSISGQLIDRATQFPIASERVHLLDVDGNFLDLVNTDEEGRYEMTRLNPGTYLMQTATDRHVNQLWPDIPCPAGVACPFVTGARIQVSLGQPAVGVDFQLDLGGIFQGSVSDRTTQLTIPGGGIYLYGESGNVVASTFPSNHRLTGMAPGSYRAVGFDSAEDYSPQLYDGIPCSGSVESCDVAAGTPIEIRSGETTHVDFTLDRQPGTCQPDAETLCLNDGRFLVQANWRTDTGAAGRAQAAAIDSIDDSGAFWFFDQANTEIVVKVLDACVDPFQRFWVFATGLTNVQVQMTVVDTLTGEQQVYFNPLNSPFQPIQDTQAFATCGPMDGAPSATAGSLPAPEGVIEDLNDQLGRDGACTPTLNALCLGDNGRFQVEAAWRTSTGDAGTAVGVPFAEDTGMFWFFGPDNVELIVKVLDACVDPFQHFWVFAGGLTNVEVTLTVTDTVSDAVRVYRNPLNTSFQPILDTQAFDTCLSSQ